MLLYLRTMNALDVSDELNAQTSLCLGKDPAVCIGYLEGLRVGSNFVLKRKNPCPYLESNLIIQLTN
jgi:hypothetical protein